MKRIVIINGKPKSGKDTFVELCTFYTRVYNFSSIDPIKEIASKYFGYSDKNKSLKDRKFLSDLKALTTEYCNFSHLATCEAINRFIYQMDRDLMFIHIREAKEIIKLKKEFPGIITLFISRPEVDNKVYTNDSDNNVEEYNYDYTIINAYTMDEYKIKAKQFIDSIEK